MKKLSWPVLTRLSWPAWTTFSWPAWTKLSWQAWTRLNWPTWTTLSWPAWTKLSWQAWTTLSWPAWTTFSWPAWTKLSWQAWTRLNWPTWTTLSWPAWTKLSWQAWTRLSCMASMNKVELASMNKVELGQHEQCWAGQHEQRWTGQHEQRCHATMLFSCNNLLTSWNRHVNNILNMLVLSIQILITMNNLVSLLKIIVETGWTILLVQQCYSHNDMITMLFKHCSGNNPVTTWEIFTCVCGRCTLVWLFYSITVTKPVTRSNLSMYFFQSSRRRLTNVTKVNEPGKGGHKGKVMHAYKICRHDFDKKVQ